MRCTEEGGEVVEVKVELGVVMQGRGAGGEDFGRQVRFAVKLGAQEPLNPFASLKGKWR